ncbi:MAG TPA: hypothetical protein VFS52_14475 [Steroidobacteraceae bacterium]|nr:hypothetical protein [Steroidobacteraceae bacterium]
MIRAASTRVTERTFRAVSRALALGCLALLAACAATPTEPEQQRLDPNTGTTLTVMSKPVELIIDRTRGSKADPFAYLAPFETNRMGTHELYLWISAPQGAVPLDRPQVFCGDQAIQLEPANMSLQAMGLSEPPYKLPAPWSAQWYFKLSGEVLDCFAAASRVRIVTQAPASEPDQFTAEGSALSGLSDFAMRVRT